MPTSDPAPMVHNPDAHGADGRLGWESMRCSNGFDGCEDLSCVCRCHDERDREAVATAFRRGLTDV